MRYKLKEAAYNGWGELLNINIVDNIIVVDIETTGLIEKSWMGNEFDEYPHIVSIGWVVFNGYTKVVEEKYKILKPDNFTIPIEAENIHGISTKKAQQEGCDRRETFIEFVNDVMKYRAILVGHNIDNFDLPIINKELERTNLSPLFYPTIDTMLLGVSICRISLLKNKYKYPTLQELHLHLFLYPFDKPHVTLNDIYATAKCFYYILEKNKHNINDQSLNLDTLTASNNLSSKEIGIFEIIINSFKTNIKRHEIIGFWPILLAIILTTSILTDFSFLHTSMSFASAIMVFVLRKVLITILLEALSYLMVIAFYFLLLAATYFTIENEIFKWSFLLLEAISFVFVIEEFTNYFRNLFKSDK